MAHTSRRFSSGCMRPSRCEIAASTGARLSLGVSKLPNPDISEADRVVVVLQFQRQLGWGLLVRLVITIRQADEGDVVLNQYAVMQHRENRGADNLPCRVKSRTMENNVVALPLAGRPARIDQGRILAVDCRCLPVRIGFALVGIEDLDFIKAHQVNPTIPAILILAVRRVGSCPFHVELAVAESLLGLDVAGARSYLEITVSNFPFGRPAFDRFPGGKVFAVEKNNRV